MSDAADTSFGKFTLEDCFLGMGSRMDTLRSMDHIVFSQLFNF